MEAREHDTASVVSIGGGELRVWKDQFTYDFISLSAG